MESKFQIELIMRNKGKFSNDFCNLKKRVTTIFIMKNNICKIKVRSIANYSRIDLIINLNKDRSYPC